MYIFIDSEFLGISYIYKVNTESHANHLIFMPIKRRFPLNTHLSCRDVVPAQGMGSDLDGL